MFSEDLIRTWIDWKREHEVDAVRLRPHPDGVRPLLRLLRRVTTLTRMEIRDLRPLDWPEVAGIYEDGMRTGNATFETARPVRGRRGTRRTRRSASSRSSTGGPQAGLRSRRRRTGECYRGVVENSVYVASWAQGQGVGRGLLEALIERSEEAGIWTLRAGIFPENKASVRLHLGCGFRLVGVRERARRAERRMA